MLRGPPARRAQPGREPTARSNVCPSKASCELGDVPSENSARLLFDDVLLEALDEGDHLPLLGLRHLELRHGRRRVAEEHAPVGFADAHTSMRQRHVPAAVVHGAAGARAEEVDQQLLLTLDPVIAAMRLETAELRVAPT